LLHHFSEGILLQPSLTHQDLPLKRWIPYQINEDRKVKQTRAGTLKTRLSREGLPRTAARAICLNGPGHSAGAFPKKKEAAP
jgi:hypothetical protein